MILFAIMFPQQISLYTISKEQFFFSKDFYTQYVQYICTYTCTYYHFPEIFRLEPSAQSGCFRHQEVKILRISRTDKLYISRTDKLYISRTDKPYISRTDKLYISQKKELYISRTDQRYISRADKLYISRTEKTWITKNYGQ